MTSGSIRYSLRTYRWDQVWLAAAFWALFVLMALLAHGRANEIDIIKGFLGAVLPLLGGILSAYSVLDDPALELHFAAPVPAGRMLAERLGLTLAIAAVAALSYQVFLAIIGFDMGRLGGYASVQLSWLVPTLTLTALGCSASFALRQSSAGALLAGAVWIVQLIIRGWFLKFDGPSYIMLFMGILRPTDPRLAVNRVCLTGLAAILLAAARALLKKQERYL